MIPRFHLYKVWVESEFHLSFLILTTTFPPLKFTWKMTSKCSSCITSSRLLSTRSVGKKMCGGNGKQECKWHGKQECKWCGKQETRQRMRQRKRLSVRQKHRPSEKLQRNSGGMRKLGQRGPRKSGLSKRLSELARPGQNGRSFWVQVEWGDGSK